MSESHIKSAFSEGESATLQARAQIEKAVEEVSRRVERILHDGLKTLRDRSQPYVDDASARFDDASKYVVARVQDKPMTATLAALGVGVLIGLLISGRSK